VTGDPKSPSRARNLTISAMAGLAGFSTIVLVILALLAGLWLDSRLGVRGPCTIGLVLLSIPASLLVMLRIVLAAAKAVKPLAEPSDQGEQGVSSSATKED
jgi:hypothetical protein